MPPPSSQQSRGPGPLEIVGRRAAGLSSSIATPAHPFRPVHSEAAAQVRTAGAAHEETRASPAVQATRSPSKVFAGSCPSNRPALDVAGTGEKKVGHREREPRSCKPAGPAATTAARARARTEDDDRALPQNCIPTGNGTGTRIDTRPGGDVEGLGPTGGSSGCQPGALANLRVSR
jgi:hypothetical protein